jgi:TetR/AcrR family transcriptional repressor of mexJK operon
MQEGTHASMSDTDVLSPEKHRIILAGAAMVFAQDGYEGASMARIASCSGVSKGTLYNYFVGKAEMFSALIGMECERHLAHVFDIEDPDGDPAAAMQVIGERMLRMMISETGLTIHRLVVAEAHKFPELARGFYESGPARAKAFMAAWLVRQVNAGHLAMSDPVFAAEQFFSLCQTHIAMRCRLNLMRDVEEAQVSEVVRSAVTMFLTFYGVKT